MSRTNRKREYERLVGLGREVPENLKLEFKIPLPPTLKKVEKKDGK